MITGQQTRAARELLGWTPYRLDPRAGHRLALAIMPSSAAPVCPPISPPSSSTIAPSAASRPKASLATAMTTSSIGAGENTVKKAIAAPRLLARLFHQPASLAPHAHAQELSVLTSGS